MALLRSSHPTTTTRTTKTHKSGGIFSRRAQPTGHRSRNTFHGGARAPAATTTRGHRSHRHHHTGTMATTTGPATTTHKSRGGLFSRRQRAHKPTFGERVSGALKRMKGSVTGNPVEHDNGVRRMNGVPEKKPRRKLF